MNLLWTLKTSVRGMKMRLSYYLKISWCRRMRCGAVLIYIPFFAIYNQTKKPLSLIEIGTSAGLQLVWDHYSYSYGDEKVYGHENSSVHLTAEIRGNNQPIFSPESPPVASRIGVDLHTNDLTRLDEYLWLRALIWPEHFDRLKLFDSAVRLFNRNKVELLEGDGIGALPKIVKGLPESSVVCIFHTHVANQFPEELKYELLEKIENIGQIRDVFHIYNNMWDGKLHIDSIIQGAEYKHTIGKTESHGRWFEWNLTSE